MYENSSPRALATFDVCLCCASKYVATLDVCLCCASRYVEATGLSPADVPLAVAVHEGMGISLLLAVSATAPPSPISHTSPVHKSVSYHVPSHRPVTPAPMTMRGPVTCSMLTLVALCLGACSAVHRIASQRLRACVQRCVCVRSDVCRNMLDQHVDSFTVLD